MSPPISARMVSAIEATGTTDAGPVNEWMRANPIEQIAGTTATIRADGATIRTVYPFRTKAPGETTDEWDLLEILGAIDGATYAPPLAESACPLVKG